MIAEPAEKALATRASVISLFLIGNYRLRIHVLRLSESKARGNGPFAIAGSGRGLMACTREGNTAIATGIGYARLAVLAADLGMGH